MLDRLKSFFSSPQNTTNDAAPPPDALAFAAAALMFEAASADQEITDKERDIIARALTAEFRLAEEKLDETVKSAEKAQADANDLHQFTKIAKTLPEDARVRLVENLWRIILSDATRDPFEDAFVRRLCALIYVPDVESGRARQRIEKEIAGGSDA